MAQLTAQAGSQLNSQVGAVRPKSSPTEEILLVPPGIVGERTFGF